MVSRLPETAAEFQRLAQNRSVTQVRSAFILEAAQIRQRTQPGGDTIPVDGAVADQQMFIFDAVVVVGVDNDNFFGQGGDLGTLDQFRERTSQCRGGKVGVSGVETAGEPRGIDPVDDPLDEVEGGRDETVFQRDHHPGIFRGRKQCILRSEQL